jgi:hypothetical protein
LNIPSTSKRHNSLETMDGSNWEIDGKFGTLPVHEEAYYQARSIRCCCRRGNAPSVNDPNVVAVMPEEHHRLAMVEDVFHRRVFSDKSWTLKQSMPNKGKDKAFDAELERLAFFANARPKASRLWKKFCDKKGMKGTLKIEESTTALIEEYDHRMEQLDAVEKAIKSTKTHGFPYHSNDLAIMNTMMDDDLVVLAAWYRISELNLLMAKNFSDISETNMRKRIDAFEREVHSTSHS